MRVLDVPAAASGTERPYEVNGERFDPLRSAEVCRGTASWYGGEFHGRKTSNGEIYDMHTPTAAHKTLPMNVYVRVTNLTNSSQQVVRINDRDPFVRAHHRPFLRRRATARRGRGRAPAGAHRGPRLLANSAPPGVIAYRPGQLRGRAILHPGRGVHRGAERPAHWPRARLVYGDASVVEGVGR